MIADELRTQIHTLLEPFFEDESRRQPVLHDALGSDSPDIDGFNYGGSSDSFVAALLHGLQDKEAYPGRNALVAIVSVVRQLVDTQTKMLLDTLQEHMEDVLENYNNVTEPNTVFVSHATADDEIAEQIAHDLKNAGINVWIDNERLHVGVHWRSEIFQGLRTAESVVVILTEHSIARPWVQREVSSAMLLNKKIFPVQLQDVFEKMQDNEVMRKLGSVQFIDFRGYEERPTYGAKLNELLENMRRLKLSQSPFKGLRSFEPVDAPLFFGRDEDNQIVRDQVFNNRDKRFSVITGASGTGKSSIMRAGVAGSFLPTNPSYDDRFADWEFSLLRLSGDPFHDLAQEIQKSIGESDVNIIAHELRQSQGVLNTYAQKLLDGRDDTTRYVLFIDQFEELFRIRDDELTTRLFLDMLYEASTSTNGRVYVVLTIRSDFFAKLIEHEGLNSILNAGGHLRTISYMSRDNLLNTIIQPARRVGLVYEGGLANQILDDATAQAGALPLLQYALQELYEQRAENVLKISTYEAMGGLKQALVRHAESVYAGLNKREQRLFHRLILELITINDDGIITRLRRDRDSIMLNDWDQEEISLLIYFLLSHEARLLTMSRITRTGQQPLVQIELAHEALLSEWERLKTWADDSKTMLTNRDRYQRLAVTWQKNGQQSADLLRESNLVSAVEWLQLPDADNYATELIRECIIASVEHDADKWDDSGRDVDLLVGSQFEYLQTIHANTTDDSMFSSQFVDFIHESTLAESNPYHVNVILWMRDEDITALNIPLEPAQQWIESPDNQGMLTEDYKTFFKAVFALRADEWDKNNRSRDYLLKRHEIDRMRYLIDSAQQTWYISDLFAEYVRASEANQRRVQRIQALVTAVVTILAVAAGYLAFLANERAQAELIARQDAETQRDLAESRQLAVQAQLALNNGDLAGAYELGIESYSIAETTDSLSSLLLTLEASPQLDQYLLRSENPIHSLTVSSDGNTVALGLANGTIQFFDRTSNQLLDMTISAHDGDIWDMMYLANDTQLVTVGFDGWAKVWDMTTGELLQEIVRDEFGSMYVIASQPESDTLALGGDDGNLYLWDVGSDNVTTVQAHRDSIWGIDFSSDGTQVTTVSADRTIQVWDTSDWEVSSLVIEDAHSDWILDVAYARDDSLIVSGGADTFVKIWSAETGDLLATLDNHSNWVRDVELTADGYLLTASQDNLILMWDLSQLPDVILLAEPFVGHQETIYQLALVNDLQFLSVGDDGALIQWSSQPQLALGQYLVISDNAVIYDATINSQGNLLALAANTQLQIIDVRTGDFVSDPINLDALASTVAFAPNSTEFAVGFDNGSLELWDSVTDRLIEPISSQTQAIYDVVYSVDGRWVASAGERGVVYLQSVDDDSEITLTDHTDRVNGLAFSRDGRLLASAGHDEQIRLWDVESSELVGTLPQVHTRPIESLVFSPDGTQIYSVARDTLVMIWDVEAQAHINTLEAHTNAVSALALSANGNFLVSGGLDGDVIVWDTATQQMIGRFTGNGDIVDLLFTPDQEQVIAVYDDGTVIAWDVDVSVWQTLACRRVGTTTVLVSCDP